MRKYSSRTLLALGGLAIGFLVLGGISVAAWEYTNSNSFCANACHAVHPEEPLTHRYSRHTNVQCVECHIGRLSTFKAVFVKSQHVTHLWALLTGYDRPLTSYSMPVSTDSCESCHSHHPHKNSVLKVYRHYADDKDNSETKLGLVLRLQGRQTAEASGEGVEWHTRNRIRFIATDAQKQRIPWVEATRKDGTKVVYQDRTQTLSSEEITRAAKRVMECDDCHNQVGHPFPNPEAVLDRALAGGVLPKEFPFVKKRAKELLAQEFKSQDEARRLVEAAWKNYQNDFPELAEKYPKAWAESKHFLEERQAFMVAAMSYWRFAAEGVTWRSFPQNIGHKHSAGCFRCHNGKHRDANGVPIPINCTTCHSVPMPFVEGEIPSHLLDIINIPKPESHLEVDFMVEHWNKWDEACAYCHKKFNYGTKNDAFCANSGCHDTRWQNLTLRAKP